MRISDWSSDVCSSDLDGSYVGVIELPLQRRLRSIGVGPRDRRLERRILEVGVVVIGGVLAAGGRGVAEDDAGVEAPLTARAPVVERKSGGEGKRVAVRVDIGGRR